MKQYTKQQTVAEIKKLLQRKQRLTNIEFQTGVVIFTHYNAKDKSKVYDKTPFFMVLKTSRTYTLGLNFHWIPMSMRIWLIRYIVRINKERLRNGYRIKFTYKQIKPLLKKMGFAPCIRLYINKRISKYGVVIPPERLIEIAPISAETFTGVPEEKLYNLVKKKRI